MPENPTPPVVLLIEDDRSMRNVLRTGLASAGFLVHQAETGRAGLVEFNTRRPDLILLDLGLPDMNGIDIIREIRKTATTPIIVLSARSAEATKIAALDTGADDYLTKPFAYGELLARARVALRHAASATARDTPRLYINGPLQVDLDRRIVTRAGQPVHLTPIQFRLLQCLVLNAGKVLTQKHLLREVWGRAHADNPHYLRIYMSQLRQKLETDPTQPTILITEAGIGYRIADPYTDRHQ